MKVTDRKPKIPSFSTQGICLPVLGLGTAHIGGTTRTAEHENDTEETESLKTNIELGFKHIDTAALYANGHTEELVGKAISAYERQDLLVSTKVWKNDLSYAGVINSVSKSLSRLKTDYIDLLCIHAPNDKYPLSETLAAMNELVDIGKVKHIGVSNFNVNELEEAIKLSKHPIVTNQIEYNLLVREKSHFHNLINMESEIIPFCQKNNIIVTATAPLARGEVTKSNPVMDKLKIKYKKTAAQIALRWLIQKPNVVTVVKCSNINHAKENLGALDWEISAQDMILLDREY